MLGWFRNKISMFGWVSWKQNYYNWPRLYSIPTVTNFDYHVPMCSIFSYIFSIVLWFFLLATVTVRQVTVNDNEPLNELREMARDLSSGRFRKILQEVGGIVFLLVGIWKSVIFWGDHSFIICRDLWPDQKIQAGGDKYSPQIYVSCRTRWWQWILTR